jgi:DNA-binding IclR family transcriptional regulator
MLLEDALTSSKIAKILEILNDEQWHTLKEIQEKIQLNKSQLQQIIRFLKEYNFIIVDEESKEIRIEKTVQQFLTKNLRHESP